VVLRKRVYELSQSEIGDLINSAESTVKKLKIGYEFPLKDHASIICTVATVSGVAYGVGIL
jgi:hypothetical protein